MRFIEDNKTIDSKYYWRREVVFIILSGLFLGSLTMLNILGISRFLDFSFSLFGVKVPFSLAIGVLPYPVTFLCTDFISEIYGKRRANLVVWVGLLLNIWVVFVLWIGGVLDQPESYDSETGLVAPGTYGEVFYQIRKLSFGAIGASMIAYLLAQFVDVHVFHWVKKKTKGKKLWLRNNVSTLTSQLIDSIAVILITHYYAQNLPVNNDEPILRQLMFFIMASYIFKMTTALLDTIPFYWGTKKLKRYLGIEI